MNRLPNRIAAVLSAEIVPGGPAITAFRAAHPADPSTWPPADFEGYLDACAADLTSGAVPRPDTVKEG